MTIQIIIPIYNEARTIQTVLTDLVAHGYKNIVVIDDGSTDEGEKLAVQDKNTRVLRHPINRGLGAALGTGLELAKKENADVVVTFDGDCQHQAKDLKNLLEPIIAGKADVAIGSRFRGDISKMPPDRMILNLLSNLMTFLFYGVVSSDSLSGLRAFNKKAISCIKIKTDGMEVSNEFLKEIKRNKLKLVEIPIDAVYSSDTIKGSKQEKFAALRIPIRLIAQMLG